MAKLVDATGKVLFQGYEQDMKEAFMYLTMSSVEMAERGYSMADLYRFNEAYYQPIKGIFAAPLKIIHDDAANDFFMRIDWAKLRVQKDTILALQDAYKGNYDEFKYIVESLDGIVSLIDSLQDFAVDVLKVDSRIVFNLKEE